MNRPHRKINTNGPHIYEKILNYIIREVHMKTARVTISDLPNWEKLKKKTLIS